MKNRNVFRKSFTVVLIVVLSLLFTIGAATWFMISESKEKPIYNPNSAFYIYLHGQEVDYTGEGQLPVPMLNGVRNDDIMDLSDPAIKYKYRKVGDKNNQYSAEMAKPVEPGEYYILFWSIKDQAGDEFASTEVKFIIKTLDPIINSWPTFEPMYWGNDLTTSSSGDTANGYFTIST